MKEAIKLKLGSLTVITVAAAVSWGSMSKAEAKCYSTRFKVQAGGLVHDVSTGLTWQQSLPGPRDWSAAKAYCSGLGSPWRLPSVRELQTIVDESRTEPAIDLNVFPNTPATPAWAFDQNPNFPTYAWLVHFSYGNASSGGIQFPQQVRCVR